MATTEKVARGFGVKCILCGDADASVRLKLEEVTEFECDGCDGTFTAEEVREHIRGWEAVLAWVEQAPVVEG